MIQKKNNYNYKYNLEEVINHLEEFPVLDKKDILYNLGGVLNHILYFNSMSKNKEKPLGIFKNALENKYKNFENFLLEFKNMALKIRGSGYTFLVTTKDGTLEIINTKNQETPISYGYIPLFAVDMWEHAYYLNYKNEKGKYLDNFLEIADFKNASQIFNNLVKR